MSVSCQHRKSRGFFERNIAKSDQRAGPGEDVIKDFQYLQLSAADGRCRAAKNGLMRPAARRLPRRGRVGGFLSRF